MPSKCAAMKATPGSLVTSAKPWLGTVRPPTVTLSLDMKPEQEPLPYWMEYFVPLAT